MKYGVNSLIWTGKFDRSHLPLLPKLKQGGFDGIEIVVFDLKDFPVAETRKGLEANAMQCTFCTAVTREASCISDDPASRKKARIYAEDCAKTAADLGTNLLAGVWYSPIGYIPGRRRTEDEWKREVEFLQSIGPTLERNGLDLAIEPINRYETFFLNTIADTVRLCEEAGNPRIGVLMDTYHSNIEEKSIPGAVRVAGRHLKHVHSCENDRGIPGSGHIPWPEIFKAFHEVKYDGWLIIETFGYVIEDIATAASIWRDLAPSPDHVAYDGVKYLKTLAATA
jgi:D-psicose/D-tagatose/L-ribulose 3-epimerase